MWFFWWDGRGGRGGGARFFWGFFFLFFMMNFMRGGFFPLIIFTIFVFMVIGAMRGTSQLMNDSQSQSRRDRRRYDSSRRVEVGKPPRPVRMPTPPPMQPIEDVAQEHALVAARAVGINPQTASVLPIDIGMVAYDGDETVVHRAWRIDETADALQPFVNLRVKHAARGRLRFEVRDEMGELVFFYERDYSLSVGENLIMPPARMPIDQSSDKSGVWTLRVLGDNLPLAEHQFEWQSGKNSSLGEVIGSDGEISDDMRAMLARTRLERMSLDELLGDEGEESAKKQGR